jgi:hypothetical protein
VLLVLDQLVLAAVVAVLLVLADLATITFRAFGKSLGNKN